MKETNRSPTACLSGLALLLCTAASPAASQTFPEAISFTQGWNSHSPASWHFQQVIDFSNASSLTGHRRYATWRNNYSGHTVRFMDFQHRASANTGGKCWDYTFANVPGPDWTVHANVGSTTTADWRILSYVPGGPPRWRLWVSPGTETRNYGAVFRLSALNPYFTHNEGVATLRIRHIDDFGRTACESTGAATLRIVNSTRTVVRTEIEQGETK